VRNASGYAYRYLFITGILLLYSVYIWRTFSGYYFYDDFEYAHAAYRQLEGSFILANDTFTHRLAFIFLISCAYALFGINDFSTVLLPAVSFFGTIVILFLYLRQQKPLSLYAVAITGLNSYFLFFIDKLTPDVLVTFLCLLAGIVAQMYRGNHPVKAGLFAGFLLFAAFLTKETSMYLWPFFGFLVVVEWLQQTTYARPFAISLLLTGVVCFACYFLLYQVYTGDLFYRFNSIMDNHYTHPESYFDKPFSYLLIRLSYAPWQMFIESGLLVALLPGLVMAVSMIYHKRLNLHSRENFWSWFSMIFLLCFYFGSTSLRYYNPLNLLPRMYFPLLPPFAILAGLFWVKAEHSAKAGMQLSMLFGAAAVYCLLIDSKYTPVYAGYTLASLCPLILRSVYSGRSMRIAFIIISLGIPVYRMIYPQQWGYQAEKRFFVSYLNQRQGKYLVVTDNRLMLTHSWFYRFQPPVNYSFTDFTAVHQLSLAGYTRIFVLFNPHTFRETFGSFEEWNRWEQKYKHQIKELSVLDDVELYEWVPIINK
jgi:hypothetical protein